MHFKHPELLYALFLLVIPVLVHLFQLRKFKKEKFTNVKFLKKASLQTRKSSQVKKWLVLCTRLLILTFLILAFAQPFLPASEQSLREQETVIYLDNSYSMQARGAGGALLRESVQDLLENLPTEENISFFTNNSSFEGTSLDKLRKELQLLSYSPNQLEWETLLLRARNLFSEDEGSTKNFILISDFQAMEGATELPAREDMNLHLVKLTPQPTTNFALDTAYLTGKYPDERELNLELTASEPNRQDIPISLYNGSQLLAKKSVYFEESETVITSFPLPSSPIEKGRIEIDDSGLEFDNELFFSINKTEPIKVVAIGNPESNFLKRIYSSPEFELRVFGENQVDFNSLSLANLVILNEPERISQALSSSLQKLVQENVYLAVIPSATADITSYNLFLRNIGLPSLSEKRDQERSITEISFNHPLFESVFNETVENFQYPTVQSYYDISSGGLSALRYENREPFLLTNNNIFLFTAPINTTNSNFQSSPLIVPAFYNMGNLSLIPPELYYVLGEPHQININRSLQNDEILRITSAESSFIPLQQSFANKVELSLNDFPDEKGHYEVEYDTTSLKSLSFNVNRSESNLNYLTPDPAGVAGIHSSIPNLFQQMESETNINALWKWFVIFALLFLLIEVLLLKFFK